MDRSAKMVGSNHENQMRSFDDFGLQSISHQVKHILLQILEERYEKAATIICSQLPDRKSVTSRYVSLMLLFYSMFFSYCKLSR